MVTADQLKSLPRSHLAEDDERFYTLMGETSAKLRQIFDLT